MKNNKRIGKHGISSARSGGKRKAFVISLIALVCALIAGATTAYVYTSTKDVKNVFGGSHISCEVDEKFDGEVKENVKIKNTGDTQCYIRANVVITWMSEDGTKVSALKPVKDEDYDIIYSESPNWQKGPDGYWYYKKPVASQASTDILITKCTVNENAGIPDGYYLSVEIMASAIQSTPTEVVKEQWNSGVSDVNGSELVIISQ